MSRLVLSPIVTHFHGLVGWGGSGHYVVTPTRVELSWIVTIRKINNEIQKNITGPMKDFS